MKTPAQIAGHPIHPMLVTVPIGLWLMSLVCDLVHASGSADMNWPVVALYTMAGGIVAALVAAIPGVIDMLSLSGAVKRTALTHMAINLTVVALYCVNLSLRIGHVDMPTLWLSIVSIGLLAMSGWLGGKMVFVHGVGVDTAQKRGAPSRPGGSRQ